MTGERVERRLAAVLAADVARYSRLMGADEEGTLARLKAVRKALVDPTIAAYHGRIVKTTGDGMLVEFASAVDAARSAVEVQRGMADQNAAVPKDQRIELRIGIHVGDIIIDDNDIFGDGVNIAARLEGIAEPGGVCISDDAQRQIRGKVDVTFDDMGLQTLKNIAEPMRAWQMQIVNPPASTLTKDVSTGPSILARLNKPSIAVLPFQNMSGDPEQEYFADGMVEEIITALSRTKSLFVISRNSSFTYKGKSVDVKQVGQDLGVRYVLEGSVRRAGNRVRITGQLIDASSGSHIWAERYDSTLEDIFDLQDRVTMSVIGAIAPQLERAEILRVRHKPTESLEAYDYYLRALACTYRFTREANIEALEFTQIANSLDHGFAAPFALGANCYIQRKGWGWRNKVQDVDEARRLARRAMELDKDDAWVLATVGQTLAFVVGETDEGASLLERAVSLNPNLATARYWKGWTKLYIGEVDVAIDEFQVALRLSPLDPRIFIAQTGMAYAHFLAGRYEEGSAWAKIAVQQQPNFLSSIRISMACHAMAGRLEDARKACMVGLNLDPTQCISRIKDRFPFRRPQDIQKFMEAFRIAGLPE